jgi:hypothetical protein
MKFRPLPCLLALAFAAPVVHADPVYVVDQLVVSVESEPGGDGERVGQVKSGDKLELIERQHDEAHVRLPNGHEGWIKASYISAELPLQNRLNERTTEIDKLKQDVSRLQSELASARASPPPPPPATKPASDPVAAPATTASAPPADHDETDSSRAPEQPTRPVWEWVVGTTIVMLLVGFALGWRTLDRRIRRKYGGLRIY